MVHTQKFICLITIALTSPATPLAIGPHAFFTLSGGSFGFQVGAEGVDLVMLVMNQNGMQALLSDKFQIGGEASAAAGPVGCDATAASDWKAHPILIYSRAKGASIDDLKSGKVRRPSTIPTSR